MEQVQILKKHVDGKWWTTEYNIYGHKCEIKMREMHGSKIHIWNKDENKVLKTFRFSFATDTHMLTKAENWIKNNLLTK